MDPNQAKFTQNWTFLATYTPDMVIIWPHLDCSPIFLSQTTYTSHIAPHMGSGAVHYLRQHFRGGGGCKMLMDADGKGGGGILVADVSICTFKMV